MKRKGYLRPVYVMGALAVLDCIWGVLYMMSMTDLPGALRYSMMNWSNFFGWGIVWLVEAFLYWSIRNRPYSRRSSFMHTSLMVILLLTRILLVPLILLGGATVSAASLVSLRGYAIRIITIAGHIFFIDLLLQAFKKQPPPKDAAAEPSPHLLDDIIDDPSVKLR